MPKEDEVRNINARRRNLLYLIHRYIAENGYYNAAETLKQEARLSDELELCDNVDLDIIYLDYASFAQLKFGKLPKILKQAQPKVKVEVHAAGKQQRRTAKPAPLQQQQTPNKASPAHKQLQCHTQTLQLQEMPINDDMLQVTVRQLTATCVTSNNNNGNSTSNNANEQLMRLQEVEHGSSVSSANDMLLNCHDWQALADLVKSTILQDDFKLTWASISGNSEAVEIVKEAVIAPLKHPQLFVNGLKPWKSALLHGPPGSGKTLLAKVLYSETRGQVTFFNVTSSIMVSKWRGDSEKMLKVLFYLAHRHAPSVIFFDEIEGLTAKRDRPTDHESSKRFKNELLQLLDGMEEHPAGIFVLASSNLPWDIDEAFLRRFEKKLLVQLPDEQERARLISNLLPADHSVTPEQMQELVQLSQYFTGDEIRLACKEVAMQNVRRATSASSGAPAAIPPIAEIFSKIKPLSVNSMEKHIKWQQEHST